MTTTNLTVPKDEEVELTIDQGAILEFTFRVRGANGSPYDLSLFTPRGQLRRLKDRSSQLLAELTVERLAPFSSGRLSVTLGATATRLLTGKGFFDIEIEDTGTPNPDRVYRVLQGEFAVDAEVTE